MSAGATGSTTTRRSKRSACASTRQARQKLRGCPHQAALTTLGATLVQEATASRCANVPAGTPAYEQGLSAGDQIVAVDGYRATRDFLGARLEEKRPGDTVTLTVFRLDELRTFAFKLAAPREATFRIVPVRQPTPEQMKNYQSWLNAPLPKPS